MVSNAKRVSYFGIPMPDGAEYMQVQQKAYYKGKWPNMFVFSRIEKEPRHWIKDGASHERYMTPLDELEPDA